MGNKYQKEDDVFNTSQNGVVPKPTSAEVVANKVLRADGRWVEQGGGSSSDVYTLLGSWVGGASWGTRQLSDDLSSYKEIMLCITSVSASDVIINPVRISYDKFKTLNSTNKYLECAAMLSTSALCSYRIYYNSDTSIYLYANNGISAQYKGALYGIK